MKNVFFKTRNMVETCLHSEQKELWAFDSSLGLWHGM